MQTSPRKKPIAEPWLRISWRSLLIEVESTRRLSLGSLRFGWRGLSRSRCAIIPREFFLSRNFGFRTKIVSRYWTRGLGDTTKTAHRTVPQADTESGQSFRQRPKETEGSTS